MFDDPTAGVQRSNTREEYLGGNAIRADLTARRWRLAAFAVWMMAIGLTLSQGSDAWIPVARVLAWVTVAALIASSFVWDVRAGRAASKHLSERYGFEFGRVLGVRELLAAAPV